MARKKIKPEDIKEATKPKEKEKMGDVLLNTGSTMLNLALTNSYNKGFLPGHYYHLVGDSQGAKTLLSSACFAEATIDSRFDDFELIYDNTEDGNHIDLSNMFGQKAAERIRPPAYYDDGTPKYSTTVESFYYNLADAFSSGKPCIYVLDSIDALSAEADLSKFEENKEAYEKGKEGKGSMGMARAKKNSENLRKVMGDLSRSGSILIVVSQTRDQHQGYGKVCAGGNALKFYATCQIWTKPKANITKTIDGNEVTIGKNIEMQVKKNRLSGYEHTVNTSVYPSYGIADLLSVIDYLIDVKHWKKEGRSVVAPEFDFKGLPDTLIAKLEEEDKEDELRLIAQTVWNNFLEKAAPKWKKRYE